MNKMVPNWVLYALIGAGLILLGYDLGWGVGYLLH